MVPQQILVPKLEDFQKLLKLKLLEVARIFFFYLKTEITLK